MIKTKKEYLKIIEKSKIFDDFEKQTEWSFEIVQYYLKHLDYNIKYIKNGLSSIFSINDIILNYPISHDSKQMIIFAANQIIQGYAKPL